MASLNRLLCRWFGHQWHVWEAGHVHAGDDWEGERLSDGTPWMRGFRVCERCAARAE